MVRQPVESSAIKSVGHDPDKLILEVEFKNGAVWQYSPVTGYLFDALTDRANSAGKIIGLIKADATIAAVKVEPTEEASS